MSTGEMLVIAVLVLVFFGPRRLPEVGRAAGRAMREFRRSLNEIQREFEQIEREATPGPGADAKPPWSSGRRGPGGRRDGRSGEPGAPRDRSAGAARGPSSAGDAEVPDPGAEPDRPGETGPASEPSPPADATPDPRPSEGKGTPPA